MIFLLCKREQGKKNVGGGGVSDKCSASTGFLKSKWSDEKLHPRHYLLKVLTKTIFLLHALIETRHGIHFLNHHASTSYFYHFKIYESTQTL